MDGRVEVTIGAEPCFMNDDAAEGCGDGVFEGNMLLLIVSDGKGDTFVIVDTGVERDVFIFAVVDEVDGERRLTIEILDSVDDTCFCGVSNIQFQVACHFQHGRFRGENHHLVIDGAVVECASGEHVANGCLANGIAVFTC